MAERLERANDQFQSLTRDSNHSNPKATLAPAVAVRFQSLTRDSNHSNYGGDLSGYQGAEFQSLTRDSNHSNIHILLRPDVVYRGFNPSRGIAIIQTDGLLRGDIESRVSIPHAG